METCDVLHMHKSLRSLYKLQRGLQFVLAIVCTKECAVVQHTVRTIVLAGRALFLLFLIVFWQDMFGCAFILFLENQRCTVEQQIKCKLV